MTDMINDVRSVLKEKHAVRGAERTLKLLRKGKLKKVFLSANVEGEIKKDILHYSNMAGIQVVELGMTNEDLGTLCKKPFSISVMGVASE